MIKYEYSDVYDPEDVARAVREVLSFNLDIDVDKLGPEKHIVEDLLADELALVEILIALEEVFELDIDDGELFAQSDGVTETVGDVIKYMQMRVLEKHKERKGGES